MFSFGTVLPNGNLGLVLSFDRAVQVALYLRVLQESGEPIREALFVALNKEDGSLHQRLLSYSPEHAEKGLENLRLALTLPPEEIPRPHAPDEAGRLPWQCVYCDFWRVC